MKITLELYLQNIPHTVSAILQFGKYIDNSAKEVMFPVRSALGKRKLVFFNFMFLILFIFLLQQTMRNKYLNNISQQSVCGILLRY
jgi:hypothetical protein